MLGLGSRSTLWYLEALNAACKASRGGFSTLPLVLLNTDFDRINPFLPNDFPQLTPVLAEYLSEIRALGADTLLIPNITLHETLDHLEIPDGLDILHPLDLAMTALDASRPVMVLGTRYTMEGVYFSNRLDGFEVHAPQEEDRALIDDLRTIAYDRNPDSALLTAFAHKVVRWTADFQVVLACTELSLVYQSFEAAGVFDLAQLQIDAGLRVVLSDPQ